MSQIGEYTTLPLSIPPTPSFPTQTQHTLYLRPHAPKIPSEADARSLFIVNLPIDSTSDHFRSIFTHLLGVGKFESIAFSSTVYTPTAPPSLTPEPLALSKKEKGKKRKRENEVEAADIELPRTWDREVRASGSSAVVVLVDEKSVEGALKAIRKLHKAARKEKGNNSVWPVWGEGLEDKLPALGSARYLSHQRLQYPDEEMLQARVDAFMTLWNSVEEQKARLAKRARNEPDEDGFITVTRGGRTGPARREDAEEKRKELEEKERKKREDMGDFYRFQTRERRKKEQGELVKRFEEDRKRVESMKEKRGRFRPEQ
ncbi:ribosomal RNA-processing protein 7-domain-containing protein [Bisporella sp. PMI_857]|nr:ribosomal RNA-processing protein 7-domain-containing protein [Bisporella sp. PMI_857]